MQALNFKEIDSSVDWVLLLNALNAVYTETREGWKGYIPTNNGDFHFILNTEKRIWCNPQNKTINGGAIKLVENAQGVTCRPAAAWIKELMNQGNGKEAEKKPLPTYRVAYEHADVQALGIPAKMAEEYDIGYVASKGIMSGMVGFKIHDHGGEYIGYMGIKKDGKWFVPKGLKLDFVWNLHRIDRKFGVLFPDIVTALKHYETYGQYMLALPSHNMTEEQGFLLGQLKHILCINMPDNVPMRLMKNSYVRAIKAQ